MKPTSPFVQTFAELPAVLPIFPLPGAALLPHGHLPLNIFEPRYLNMIADAMASDRLIGMIQTLDENIPTALAAVGCAGRIIRYEEMSDGRLEILLRGVCRFRFVEELDCLRGYRMVKPSWQDFAADTEAATPPVVEDVLMFKGVLRNYLKEVEVDFEAGILDKLDIEDLVNSLIGFLAITDMDKQILLESTDLADRVKTFSAILQAADTDLVRH